MTSYHPSLAGQRRGSIPGLYPEAPGSFGQLQQQPYRAPLSPPSDQPMDIDELKSPETTRSYSPPRQPASAPLYPSITTDPVDTDLRAGLSPPPTGHKDRSAIGAAEAEPHSSPANTVTASARELAEQFAWVLTTRKHDLLDQEHGILMTYASMCEDRVADLKTNAAADASLTGELATIKAEARTWLLFRTILMRRQNAGFVESEPQLEDVPYFSDKVAAANALKDDDDLVELMLVQTWLEESFQRVLQTANLPLYPASRVTADPVAPASADESNAEAFFKVVFDLVQAGLVDKAKMYAERCQRTWVALALAGCKWHDVDGGDEWNSIDAVEGNLNRNLFKTMCSSMASQSGIGRYERAVFSLLGGHLEGVLPVCDTYESALHAIVACAAEARTAKFVGSDASNDFFHVETTPPLAPGVDLSKLTLWDIFKSLKEGKLVRKLDIKPAVTALHNTFFPGVHARLLADRANGLVDLLEWFKDRHDVGALDLSQRRFATHLVLAVRQLHLVRRPTHSSRGKLVDVEVVMRELVHGYILALRQATGLLPAIPVYARAVPAEHRPALMANALVSGPVEEWGEVFKRMDKMQGGFDSLEVAVAVVRQVADQLIQGGSAFAVKENNEASVKLIHGVQLVVAYGSATLGDHSEEMLKRVVPVVTLAVRVLLSAEEWDMAAEVAGSVALGTLSPHARYVPTLWQFWELVDYQAFLRVIHSPFAFVTTTSDSDSDSFSSPETSTSFPTGLDLWLSDTVALLESNWLQFQAATPISASAAPPRHTHQERQAMAQSHVLYTQFARMLVTRVAANLAPVSGAFPTLVHRLLAVMSRHREAVYTFGGRQGGDAAREEEAQLVENMAKCMTVVRASALREEAAWGKASKARFIVDARVGGVGGIGLGAARERGRGLPRPDVQA